MSSRRAPDAGRRRGRPGRLFALAGLLLIAACAAPVPSPEERTAAAGSAADAGGWRELSLPAGGFTLAAWVPASVGPSGGLLTVYLEGDGFAWRNSETPSTDPTPRNPVALHLALAQPGGAAAYLARPCQYRQPAGALVCDTPWWTDKRFAPEIVESMDAGVSALKARFGASRLQLVGFSGGGGLAVLVASRRDDVARIVTVGGNLDLAAWTRLHGLRPLAGSLDPGEVAGRVASIPQVHFSGAADEVVPPAVAEAFRARLRDPSKVRLEVVPGYDHACCWAETWAARWTTLGAP